jgi:Yip1 domain
MDDMMTPGGAGLVDRAKAILLKPKETWPVIAGEAATPQDLITRYALPLIAIGPVASFLGGQLFGYSLLGVTYKPGLVSGLTTAIVSLLLGVVGAVVVALVADWLAPRFGGTANRVNAFKLVVYSGTAGWLAAIFGLIPALGILGLLGLYSLYLLYTGATPLMKVPEDKAVGFTAVTVVCAGVVLLIAGVLVGTLTGGAMMAGGMGGVASSGASDGELSGKLTVPGVGSIDAAKLEAAGKQMEAAANGSQKAVAPAAMQALLPASLGAYQRTAIESAGAGNIGGTAEGTYTAGDKTFRLKLIDMSGLGALAGLGAAMGVEQSREDANGFERTSTVNGQLQTEKWNSRDGRGKFAVTLANRFMIEAEGEAASLDELKAAVASVDKDALQALAK